MARESSIWEQLFGQPYDYSYPPKLRGGNQYDFGQPDPYEDVSPRTDASQLRLPPIMYGAGGPPPSLNDARNIPLPPPMPSQGYGGRLGGPPMAPSLSPQQLPIGPGPAPGMPTFSQDIPTQPVLPPAPAPLPQSAAGAPAEPPLWVPKPGSLADRVTSQPVPRDAEGNMLLWPWLRDNVLPNIESPLEKGRSLAGTPYGAPSAPAAAPSSMSDTQAGQAGPGSPRPTSVAAALSQPGQTMTQADVGRATLPPMPAPIDVGGAPTRPSMQVATNDPYSLPVGGTMAAPTDNAQLPATSRPVQGTNGQMLPDVQTAARQIAASAPPGQLYAPPQNAGAFDRISAALHNLGGSQSFLGGMADLVQGAATGQRLDPQGMTLNAQNNMYRALLQRGYPQEMAMAGATNPEILKSLVAPPTWGIIGEGIGGTKRYGFINPQMQTINGQPAGAGGGAAGGNPIQGNYTDAQWDAMSSEQRLATLPKADQQFISDIYHAKVAPSTRNAGYYQAVSAIYPDFDQQDYFKRHETLKSFEGQGKNALEKKALNTAITHADNLYSMIDELPNTTWFPGYVNPFIHALKANTGDTRFQELRGRWDAQAEGLANELSKMLNGGQTSEADRSKARAILAMAKSPAELKASINQLMEMAQGRAQSLQQLYDQGMKQPTREGLDMVDPQNRQVFMRLRGVHGGPVVSAGGQVAPTQAPPLVAGGGLVNGHIPPPPPGFRILQ